MGKRDLIFDPFEKIITILGNELEPEQWPRVMKLLDYYITRELERLEVVPDDTPIPIATNIQV